jgi:hypothetical protein
LRGCCFSSTTIVKSSFLANSAGTGGAILVDSGAVFTIAGCSFALNTATGGARAGPTDGAIKLEGQSPKYYTNEAANVAFGPLPDPNTDAFLQAQPEIGAHSWEVCFDSSVNDASSPAVFHAN